MDKRWVEGDRLERGDSHNRLTAVVVRSYDGVVLRVSDNSVLAGSQKNLSQAGWHLQHDGYNLEKCTTLPYE